MMVKCKGFPKNDEATTTWKSKTMSISFGSDLNKLKTSYFLIIDLADNDSKDSIDPSLAITNHDAEEPRLLVAKEDVNHMIPDPDLTELASCSRFQEIPDRDLTELASCSRFAEILDPDLTELASCSRFAEIPDWDLTELASCSCFAEITDPNLTELTSCSRFAEIPDPDLTELDCHVHTHLL
ncbi:hypothetical protein V6N11_072332 [Hibiscus sabdariffa]|uniref:Uncharacterized protein n=1 Tax=Hibiscus sabdariffa TaxID=183260 RepID=A0ABR2U2Z8_9ROSI